MHGCITDPESLVFTEQDYYNYFNSHPLMVDLLSTKLANSPMLFIGYSAKDLDFKLMLERIRNYLGTGVPAKYILLANETKEEAEYLKKRGFSPILIEKKELPKTEILENFLTRLADDVAIHAYTKFDRAKILLRENKNQLQNANPNLIIRNSTNLGAWAIPKPADTGDPLFDSSEIDKLEYEASTTWDTFYTSGVKFKCIYCINPEWILRKYRPEHAEKRLMVFLTNVEKFDSNQVQITSKDNPFDSSQTIYGKDVLVQLTKRTPDERTYTHAEVIRNKFTIHREISIFDSHFESIKRSNLAKAKQQGVYDNIKSVEQNLHDFILKKTEETLKEIKKNAHVEKV